MLVTMKEILDRAKEGNYGVTAPNVQSEDTVRAVIEVAEKCKAPMIIDVNAFIHPDLPWFVHMIRDLASQASVPIAINLDHGRSYEDIMLGIRSGFTSIMVDRSALSYEENRDQTKEVVKMCKPLGMTVEAELGHVGMGTNYEVDGVSNLTVPEEAAKFIEETVLTVWQWQWELHMAVIKENRILTLNVWRRLWKHAVIHRWYFMEEVEPEMRIWQKQLNAESRK